jgi:hypothetical protein
VQYEKLGKKPSNAKLAKNVPEKGMHGYLPALPKELTYWEERAEIAIDLADTAIYDLAGALIHDLKDVNALTPGWRKYGAIDRSLNRKHLAWRAWENGRRDRLGVIAMSTLCRHMFPTEVHQQIVDYNAMPEEEREVQLLPEPSARNEEHNVVDPRMHMPGNVLDGIFEDRYDPATEGPAVWYRSLEYDGLYVRREATGNPTTSYELQLLERGVRVDFDSLQTIFPYLPAR